MIYHRKKKQRLNIKKNGLILFILIKKILNIFFDGFINFLNVGNYLCQYAFHCTGKIEFTANTLLV